MRLLLSMIPRKLVIALVWQIISPILQKKVEESTSQLDNQIFKELKDLFEELSK